MLPPTQPPELTAERLEELKQLYAKASPGTWEYYELDYKGAKDGIGHIRNNDEKGREIHHVGDMQRAPEENRANGQLTAEMFNTFPALLHSASQLHSLRSTIQSLKRERDEAMEKGAKWDMHERKKCEYCGSSEHLHTASMPCPGCGAPQCCTICCKMENLKQERDSLRAQVQQWKAAHEADKSVNASLRSELATAKERIVELEHNEAAYRQSWEEAKAQAIEASNSLNRAKATIASRSKELEKLRAALMRADSAMNTCKDHCYSDGSVHHQSYDSIKVGEAHIAVRQALSHSTKAEGESP